MFIGTIIGWLVAGLIVGAIARLLVRGKQSMGVIMTVVLGIVGVSRLAMEEGYTRASLFGAALAGALGLVLPPKAWPILALVWWAAYKLTWDCTLIDDTQDASGEGLLQRMGLDSSAVPASNAPPGTTMPSGRGRCALGSRRVKSSYLTRLTLTSPIWPTCA